MIDTQTRRVLRRKYLTLTYPMVMAKGEKLEGLVMSCQERYGVSRRTVFNDLKRLGFGKKDQNGTK
ncbi:hypothetical protein FUAX_41900 (plasmid) [Fulvitalea axinellae]|uniref:Uncharacterized protein n=1 Tax=Fulvitalea axinellae TaxID=1182444 RepID=A0AAU9CNA1_9BACT|nr:hypothetical protein FUAX_41900 [Fulvitalea axinellae]